MAKKKATRKTKRRKQGAKKLGSKTCKTNGAVFYIHN